MTALACTVCTVRVYVTSRTRPAYRCADCGVILCGRHTYLWMDESNRAISANARPQCALDYDVDDNRNRGEVGPHNLLLSGDYPHRVAARARFRVELTGNGSKVTHG